MLACVEFTDFASSIPQALDAIKAPVVLEKQNRILIKPNLVNPSPPPITTPTGCCRAIIDYIRCHADAEILIGEGCGDATRETSEVFDLLGYTNLAANCDVALIDLNHEPLRRLSNPSRPVFPEMYLPEIVFDCFLISAPVLKAHSLARMTGTLKNMIGLAPPKHYAGRHGTWKKAVFHERPHQSIRDLNHYRTPDLTVMDASVGMAEYHLGGPACDPPIGKILAGFDPLEIDRKGTTLLGIDWRSVGHLAAT